MTRVLVIYGTTHGHTQRVALELSIALRRAGAETEVFCATTAPGPEKYTAVIVAASLHAGKYQRQVGSWIREHATALRDKPAAFVSVSLTACDPKEEAQSRLGKIMRDFADSCGWSPTCFKSVAGVLAYTKYGFFTRWLMKRIARRNGGDTDTTRDHDYTDWADLRAFAREFLVMSGLVRHRQDIVA